MPKKAAKNAYFYFMLDYKQRNERNGRKFTDLAHVSQAADGEWKSMGKEERAPFEERAKREKANGCADSGAARGQATTDGGNHDNYHERYTSQGISFSELDRQKMNEERREKYIETRIVEFVKGLSYPKGLAKQEINLVMGNYFCMKDGVYYPAEMAIAKFSFQKGVIRKYHLFLNPGQIPLGFAFEAKDFSEKTHRLPCPPRAIGETDFARIFERTLEILATGNDDEHKGKPMVFVLEGVNNENVRMVRSFFQQFSDDYEKIDVLPLTRLFLELKLKAAKNGKENVVNTIHVARLFMERNPFSFSREISCSFHYELDATKECALAVVMRWCYLLADYICDDLNIKRVLGKHVPSNADLGTVTDQMREMRLQSGKANMPTTGSVISTTVCSGTDTSAQSEITSTPGQASSVITATTDNTNNPYTNDIKKKNTARPVDEQCSIVTSELSTTSTIANKPKPRTSLGNIRSRIVANASRGILSETDTDGEQPSAISAHRSLAAKGLPTEWKHRETHKVLEKPLDFDDEPISVKNEKYTHGRPKPITRPSYAGRGYAFASQTDDASSISSYFRVKSTRNMDK